MVYVALLRGINVGGNNKIAMKELAAVFEAAGMSAVRTYINSGNVVFESDLGREELAPLLEGAIAERFGLEIGVLVRDAGQMRALGDALPETWTNDADMRCEVYFLWPDVDSAEVVERMPHLDVEDLRYVPGAVIRRLDRVDARRSPFVRIIGTPLYRRMTGRNCNTVRKLIALMER